MPPHSAHRNQQRRGGRDIVDRHPHTVVQEAIGRSQYGYVGKIQRNIHHGQTVSVVACPSNGCLDLNRFKSGDDHLGIGSDGSGILRNMGTKGTDSLFRAHRKRCRCA